MKELYKDMYYRGFGPGEYEELKKAQMEIEANTSWVEDVTDIQIGALSEPMDAYRKDSDPACKIPLEVLLDTVENVGLTVMYNGTEECLRDCAMPTLLSTAGIGGLGIARTAKESKIWLADGLTAFLRASRKKSSLLMRGGKVSAILSPGYEYMPGSQLLAVCDDLQYMFGTPSFLGGSVSHELTVAEFAYPESEKVMTDAYNSALVAVGRTPYARLTPIVQYRASDTADEAAKLVTYLKMNGGHYLPVGGIKVVHIPPLEFDAQGVRKTCMEKFQEESLLLFNKLESDIQGLIPRMLSIRIDYPGNTFVKLCKYANIPQKWGGVVEEDVRANWPNGSDCTFLDIYEALTEVTALAVRDGFKPYSKRVLDLEEGISKIANNPASWKKYDLPGTIGWSASAQTV